VYEKLWPIGHRYPGEAGLSSRCDPTGSSVLLCRQGKHAHAIIGNDRAYTLPSRYWISFTPEPDQLRKMSGNIFHKGRVDPYGSLITSPDDKIIGIWYSNLYNYSVRVDQQTRTVQILFPNPENNDQPGR
jgi:hypothetical protein